ncbi:probable myosin-binding protein 6 [Cucurbita moschata]|uniref:Probable myosin-binding protein 6 n=1 Tax=Cucurbita moschata TaxID=3662 RepID=A0A6J1GQ95_CUCMO|nr:probable myosin-binding protein 6 [Cucurbita moschata]
MTFHEIHSWTFCGLVRAFLDLAVVYFLLCVSATVFIPSKILEVVGFCLPCPCTGFYGNQNPNLCLHRLLFSWPKRKIYLVLDSVKHRFPFDLILVDDQMGKNRNLLRENHHTDGVPLLQSAACCSKGNRIMFQRPRRRRASVEYGKLFRKEWEFLALDQKQDFIPDDVNESYHMDLGRRTWQGFESSGSVGENSYLNKGSSTIGHGTNNDQERDITGNEVSIRLLEQALEEEKAARASLFLELEEERAAAATAADEAIAMITRLQNEKASVEMEARQYQRVIEEKFAYDEEEMNILREILVQREIDYHVLEKEIEAYRQMDFSEKEELKRNWDFILDEHKEQSSTARYSNGDPPVVHQIENALSLSSKAKSNESNSCNSQCHFNEEGLLKQTIWTDKDNELMDNSLLFERTAIEGALRRGGFEKSVLSRGALQNRLEHIDHTINDLGSSILDMEIDVQDIHVIDEKLHMDDSSEERS